MTSIILVLSLSAVALVSLYILPESEETEDDYWDEEEYDYWDKEEYYYEEWMSEEDEEALGGW